MVQWLVLCMVAMWGDIRFGMTGATLLATRSVRGAINFFQQMFGFYLNRGGGKLSGTPCLYKRSVLIITGFSLKTLLANFFFG